MTDDVWGQIKAGKGPLIGNAGEYFVVAELLRRGVIAALAPRNTPGFDVMAAEASRSANIRVKTRTAAADSWVWNVKKDGTIFRIVSENDFTVLVDLKSPGATVDYFVLRTGEVEQALKADFQTWVSTPGRGGRPRNPENPQRRLGDWGDYPELLSRSSEKWDLIVGHLRGEVR